MDDKFNKDLIKGLTKDSGSKLRKRKRVVEKTEDVPAKEDDNSSATTAPRLVPPGTDVWLPLRPLSRKKDKEKT
jgi:hypothetical protein